MPQAHRRHSSGLRAGVFTGMYVVFRDGEVGLTREISETSVWAASVASMEVLTKAKTSNGAPRGRRGIPACPFSRV